MADDVNQTEAAEQTFKPEFYCPPGISIPHVEGANAVQNPQGELTVYFFKDFSIPFETEVHVIRGEGGTEIRNRFTQRPYRRIESAVAMSASTAIAIGQLLVEWGTKTAAQLSGAKDESK